METLLVTILPRTPRLDVKRLDDKLCRPTLDYPGNELWTVVGADMSRHTPQSKQLSQRIDYVLTRDPSITIRTLCRLLSGLDRRQQQRYQDSDNSDHHKDFNQSERGRLALYSFRLSLIGDALCPTE